MSTTNTVNAKFDLTTTTGISNFRQWAESVVSEQLTYSLADNNNKTGEEVTEDIYANADAADQGPEQYFSLDEGQTLTNDQQAEQEIFEAIAKRLIIAEIEGGEETSFMQMEEVSSFSESELEGVEVKGTAKVTIYKHQLGYFAQLVGEHGEDGDGESVDDCDIKYFAELDEAQKWATEEVYRICA